MIRRRKSTDSLQPFFMQSRIACNGHLRTMEQSALVQDAKAAITLLSTWACPGGGLTYTDQ